MAIDILVARLFLSEPPKCPSEYLWVGVCRLDDVVVGLDVHLKNTQGTIMKVNGEVLRQ